MHISDEFLCNENIVQALRPARAYVYSSNGRVHAQIFTRTNLVIESYLMSKSLKFYKDPSFRLGDIQLLVEVEVDELKI